MEMKKTEYYSYQEVLNVFPSRAPSYPCQTGLDAEWFTKLLGDLSLQYQRYALDSTITDATIKAVVNALMTNVYDRHSEDYIYRYDSLLEDSDHTLTQSDVRKAISKLVIVINITLPKYLPMLTAYKGASKDPIAPIKSESKGKTSFNDTPQNIGDWGDEDHTTNISSSESETSVDTGSLVERLSEMFKNWKSIVLEWSNEFNQCFLREEQIL